MIIADFFLSCWNLFNWRPLPPNQCWHLVVTEAHTVGKRILRILLECFLFFWPFLFSRSKKSQIPCFTKWWNTKWIWKGKTSDLKTYRKITTQCNGQSAARFLVFISIKWIAFHSILRIFFIRSTETGTRKRPNVFQFPSWKLKCMYIKLRLDEQKCDNYQCGNISALHSWWWKTASKSQCETDTDSILLILLFPFNREVHRVAGDISMKVVTGGGG